MGEANLSLFRAEFNQSLRVESRPERLTSDAGAVVLREVMERLGIVDWMTSRLADNRDPDLITHPLSELLRTSLLLLGQGWRDHDDADRLRDDAVFRLAVSDRRGTGPLEMRPREEGVILDRNPEVPDGLSPRSRRCRGWWGCSPQAAIGKSCAARSWSSPLDVTASDETAIASGT